ncbi:MAG: hypothetical protein ACXAEN_27255 [Candidatus Thorarchaeota archaeon]|jgi:hypothetical protein
MASGGKGKSSGEMPKAMRRIIKQGWEEMTDLRQGLIGTFEDILGGKETAATIPIVAQAQEAQRRATSQALTGTQEGLARGGLAGTPFGEMIMSRQRQQGAQAVQGIPAQIAQQLISVIPGFTQGQASSIMGSLPGTRETSSKQVSGGLQF